MKIAATRRHPLLIASAFCGAAYFVSLEWQPFPGSMAIKGASVGLLALMTWRLGARLLALGLAASSVGDVLLDVTSANLFVPGLCAFLAAHLIYTLRFMRHWQHPLRIWLHQRILFCLVLAYTVLFT